MAYQFLHIETYSEAIKQVNGAEGHFNSAAQVLGEALHLPKYSKHVENSDIAYRLGGTMSVDKLQAKRAQILANIRETVTRKDGTTYTRKLRKDAATFYTEIQSHPLPASDFMNGRKSMGLKSMNGSHMPYLILKTACRKISIGQQ